MGHILMKVGVKSRSDRDSECAGRRDRRSAQRCLGRNIDDIGPVFVPSRLQHQLHRETEANLAIPRKAERRHLEALFVAGKHGRAYHINDMPSFTKAKDESLKRGRHDVCLRRVGVGDKCNFHSLVR